MHFQGRDIPKTHSKSRSKVMINTTNIRKSCLQSRDWLDQTPCTGVKFTAVTYVNNKTVILQLYTKLIKSTFFFQLCSKIIETHVSKSLASCVTMQFI